MDSFTQFTIASPLLHKNAKDDIETSVPIGSNHQKRKLFHRGGTILNVGPQFGFTVGWADFYPLGALVKIGLAGCRHLEISRVLVSAIGPRGQIEGHPESEEEQKERLVVCHDLR